MVRFLPLLPALLSFCLPAQTPRASGPNFEVLAHGLAESDARAALELLEEAGARILKVLGTRPEGGPLAVHLYASGTEYEAAETARTGGRFRDNRAFSFQEDLTSHVLWEPLWPAPQRAALGLPLQVRRLLVHEVAHLLVYATFPGRGRWHPPWFAEGLAQWCERHAAPGPVPELEQPWDSDSRARLQELQRTGALPPLADVFAGVEPALERRARYALYAGAFAWLMEKHPRVMVRFLGRARKLPAVAAPSRLGVELKRVFPKQRWQHMDREFGKWTGALEPRWQEPIRSLEVREDLWLQSSLGPFNAVSWRTEPLPAAGFEWRGTVEVLGVLPGHTGAGQMNVLLDRQDSGFLAVALVASGRVVLFDHRIRGNRWQQIAVGSCPPLGAGEPAAVAIVRRGKTLAVHVAGERVLEVEWSRPWTGSWGVGVQRGTFGTWRGVEVQAVR